MAQKAGRQSARSTILLITGPALFRFASRPLALLSWPGAASAAAGRGFTTRGNLTSSPSHWRVVRRGCGVKIDCKIDISEALELVQRQLPAAVPYVKATFLTNAATGVQGAIKKQMPVAFDRPTPFTVRSVWVKPAQKSTPKAEVYFPESAANSGKSRREYIRPGTEGASARSQKRSEMLLVKAGVLPSGWVTVPGSYAMRSLLDGFGNMKGQYYRQIIRNLQLKTLETRLAKPISKPSMKRAARMGVENEFFAVTPGKNNLAKGGGWLPPGVYRRTGKGGRELLQYLKFVRKAAYRPRLEVQRIARADVAAHANAHFSAAWSAVIGRFAAKAGIKR